MASFPKTARGEEEVLLAGNAPLALDSGPDLWLVEEGTVEVFAVPRHGSGPRTHLTTAIAGQLLCSSESGVDGHDLGVLAVGHPGTRLRRLGASNLRELTRDSRAAADLAARIDAWLSGLFGEIGHAAAPRVFVELRRGAETSLGETSLNARAREGVAWIRHLEGRSRLLGEEVLALGDDDLVPVPEGLWLVSSGAVRLVCLGTEDVLHNGEFWQGIARFHDLCLRYVAVQAERTEQQERGRLERKIDLDQSSMREAHGRLASVLGVRSSGGVVLDDTSDPLLAASRLVGNVQGISIRPAPEWQTQPRQGGRLVQICEASRIRSRRVILRDDWWRRDNGPLVAFRSLAADGKAERPVALLPASARGYEMIDPVERTRTPVDAALAETLTGDAYMFYPPLPERPVTRRDLFRMALQGRRGDLVTILLMGAAGGLLGLLIPILTGQLFGNVIPSADRGQLGQITLALIVSALAGSVFQITRSIAVLRLGGKADASLQAAVWDRLLALPVSFFRQFTVGDLASRSLGINAIREMLTGSVLTSVLAAVFSVFSFALLFYYSWRLALLASALVAILAGATAGLTWLQLRHQRALLEIQGRIASLLFGLIHGIGKLRVAGAEARAYARWAERFSEQRRMTLAARRTANVQTVFNVIYAVFTTLVVFAVVGFSTAEAMPLGEFLAFNAAFAQFQSAALSLVAVLSSVLAMIPVYERLQPILETVPEVDESKAEPGELTGEIEFSHVSFRYQEKGPAILDDVSFRAGPGEFIALVGPSGAGKSTCLRLILGFEKPFSGSIYFDGQDLSGLAAQSVRRQIGVVLQTGRPMAGTIYSNIIGSSNLGINAAWEAARMAGLEDDIKAMPMGMHTVISEGAETFSGGQKQRILIARAIVHRPRIILFDEATSALDNRTQEIVSRSLEALKATRIVIAHRLSTIQNADRIYVFEGGRVVEEGTFQELLRLGGSFALLTKRQIV
jgi:NHLM bacteriocin system ABC transporter ATP-binding protein